MRGFRFTNMHCKLNTAGTTCSDPEEGCIAKGDIDFCTNAASPAWEEEVPWIASFATRHSFLLPELLGLTPADMGWLQLEPEAWGTDPTYIKIFDYVEGLEVTNDVAER
jgi:hypothetical protein